jgi:hypothetical protein
MHTRSVYSTWFLVVDHLIVHRSLFYYDSCDQDIFSFY